MPIEYLFKEDERLVVIIHVGVVPDDEFLASYEGLFGDDRYDKTFNLLVDLRRADSAVRSQQALRQFADFAQGQYTDADETTKVAVVAPKDVSFGLARMYEVFSHNVPWEFVVFRSADAALAWLGMAENLLDEPDRGS
jgi:hypothetical protein